MCATLLIFLFSLYFHRTLYTRRYSSGFLSSGGSINGSSLVVVPPTAPEVVAVLAGVVPIGTVTVVVPIGPVAVVVPIGPVAVVVTTGTVVGVVTIGTVVGVVTTGTVLGVVTIVGGAVLPELAQCNAVLPQLEIKK